MGLLWAFVIMFAGIGVFFLGALLIAWITDEWETDTGRAIRAVKAQARRDVEGSSGMDWYDLEPGDLSKRQFEKVQKAYVKEVGRLTDKQVRERVNLEALNDMSERTRKAMEAHREALKELG